jgi:DNA-binding NarL/FixJ family response regulator
LRRYKVQMGSKLQILVIDADTLLRDGLCALLNLEEGFQVAAAVSGIGGPVRFAPSHAPEIVILDSAIAGSNGVALITLVRQRWPRTRVLVLTFEGNDQALEEALRAGADGYLLKSDTRLELTNALKSMKEGQRYVSPTILDRVVHGYVRKHNLEQQQQADGLSDRERDVIKRIAQGRRTREIAQELSLSHKTIEKYRSNLMRKLGLKTATAVAAYAISHGYLES